MPHTLAQINAYDRQAFVAALGHLFEHSPWVADETFAHRPFRDAAHLHAELCATLARSSRALQLELIRAHPDLAGRLAQAGRLTAESSREQATAGLDRLASEEAEEIKRLNAEYLARFGFPFVICARLNAKDAILRAMRERVTHAPEAEHDTAIAEIGKIAWLRLLDTLKT